MTKKRKYISKKARIVVLTEAGYRCAVPTCRTILAIDLHHIIHVSEGESNDPSNLLALCPTCHALYHRGEIFKDSILAWKQLLIDLNSLPQTAPLTEKSESHQDYFAAVRVNGHNEIFVFKNKIDRDSFIDDIKIDPDVQYMISDGV